MVILADIQPAASWPYVIFTAVNLILLVVNTYITVSIKTRFAKALERAKHEWGIEAAEKNARFSLVFKETETTIATLYKMILKILDLAETHSLLIAVDEKEQRIEKLLELNNALNAFYRYYHPRKIYLPLDTAKLVQSLGDKVITIMRDEGMLAKMKTGVITASREQLIAKREGKIEAVKSLLPDLLAKLEKDFQYLFGFPVKEDKPAKVKKWWQLFK